MLGNRKEDAIRNCLLYNSCPVQYGTVFGSPTPLFVRTGLSTLILIHACSPIAHACSLPIAFTIAVTITSIIAPITAPDIKGITLVNDIKLPDTSIMSGKPPLLAQFPYAFSWGHWFLMHSLRGELFGLAKLANLMYLGHYILMHSEMLAMPSKIGCLSSLATDAFRSETAACPSNLVSWGTVSFTSEGDACKNLVYLETFVPSCTISGRDVSYACGYGSAV